jgi:hypothetical protein
MQYGQLCRKCKGIEKCKEVPSAILPVEIRCVVCGGENFTECTQCNKTGTMPIIGCPEKIITSDVWTMIELTNFYKKGLPPIAGGVLDQSHNFIEAASFIFSEQNFWKSELGID